ncbi:DUF4280 domain-containing protein [Enhygromyxa salina]|uniref:DUF4280 domain-containing protein n=1 Tax=Enhygromyxa salina TaxID=215803 RepID=A0A2S9Y5U8_9BACT|nr:DUF4280 domain-containing protein [Enhygromyxa salina]PRQ00465.1 hypothetical protein ENSA7_59590 [Enhygromyxa salina]
MSVPNEYHLQVVDGATIKCDRGVNPSILLSRSTKLQCTEDSLACDIMDHNPGVSVNSFIACGVQGGAPCVPSTPSFWVSPTDVSVDGAFTALTKTALLPCSIGGVIGVMSAGQASVYLLQNASSAAVLAQALTVYAAAFARQGRFPSTEEGLKAFMAATAIGAGGGDTPYDVDTYNCQAFADALARSLLEAGVAENVRLIHIMTRDGIPGSDPVVNHAVTEVELANGDRYIVDAQTGWISSDYSLDKNGEIPDDTSNELVVLADQRYGGEPTDYIDFGGPRDVGDTWTPVMTVTDHSAGLNSDRETRGDIDWDTEWTPNPAME